MKSRDGTVRRLGRFFGASVFMNASRLSLAGLLAGVLLALAPLHAAAEQRVTFETDYVVTLRGLTIGRASLGGKVEGDRFEVQGTLSSAGLARIFDRTRADARIVGLLRQSSATPESFMLSYAQGDQVTRTTIAFSNGDVARTDIEPPVERSAESRVPIAAADLKSVADPVSATIVARGRPDEICGRTLRIFEGGTRIDVELSLGTVGFVYGVGNHAVTCRGRFIPVSGFEREDPTFAFLRDKGDFEFVYAPAGGGIYTLHSLSTQTQIGRVEMRAQRREIGG